MPRKVWLVLSACLVFSACADPKYVSSKEFSTGGRELALSTCQARFASHYCVSFAWEKMPTEDDFGSFLFKTFRQNMADGSPIVEDLEGTMAVVLWMPSMGHGSSPVVVERLDVGTYRASKVFFTMKGDWDIRFQLKDGGNVTDQALIPITL